jgi:hypothetical protein
MKSIQAGSVLYARVRKVVLSGEALLAAGNASLSQHTYGV